MESVDGGVLSRALAALGGLGLIGLTSLGLANAIDLPHQPVALASSIDLNRPVVRALLPPPGNDLPSLLFATSRPAAGVLDAPTAAAVRAYLHTSDPVRADGPGLTGQALGPLANERRRHNY
jgi:hypothetical protein